MQLKIIDAMYIMFNIFIMGPAFRNYSKFKFHFVGSDIPSYVNPKKNHFRFA